MKSCRSRSSASMPIVIFNVMDEFTVPPDQLKAFKENKDGCVIGRKLAFDRELKVGDLLPLKGDVFPSI